MAEIEALFRRQQGLGMFPVAVVFDKSISANDTLILKKEDYPDLVIYVKVSDPCDVVLEAVSGAPRKPDGSYAKISVNKTIMSFSAAGEQTIKLSEVLTADWVLHFPYLHLKFTAATTIDFVAFPTTATRETLKQKLSINELVVRSGDPDIAVAEGDVVEVSKLEVHAPRSVFIHGVMRVHGAPYVEAGASIYVAPGGSLDVW
ncbi:MAG: hypothetical protein J7J91_03320 [Deltaproteobacteria bacterium]|nr:hypothetical protein [Deltaproteobacteria bacterium]